VIHPCKIRNHKFTLLVKIKYWDLDLLHGQLLLVKISSSRQKNDETNYAVEDK
jgi:hypothetical protein